MSEQSQRMNNAAKHGPKVGSADERKQIRAIALEVVQINQHIKDKRQLRLIIRNTVKKRMKDRYGVISWAWLFWFVVPKLIAWFFTWYAEDQHIEAQRKTVMQHTIDRARGEALG